MILYLLEYVKGLFLNDAIINLNGFTSNNVSVSKTTDTIIDVNGSTKNLDSERVYDELSIHHNNFKIKNILILFAWTFLHHGNQTFNRCLYPITEMQRLQYNQTYQQRFILYHLF